MYKSYYMRYKAIIFVKYATYKNRVFYNLIVPLRCVILVYACTDKSLFLDKSN